MCTGPNVEVDLSDVATTVVAREKIFSNFSALESSYIRSTHNFGFFPLGLIQGRKRRTTHQKYPNNSLLQHVKHERKSIFVEEDNKVRTVILKLLKKLWIAWVAYLCKCTVLNQCCIICLPLLLDRQTKRRETQVTNEKKI